MQHTQHSTILNVDDNNGARYARSRILQLAGFDLVEASNGTDALRMVREYLPALVLLDTRLPDVSGFDVCKEIKADPRTEHILVLQTSASFLHSTDKIRALEAGADNYLAEPIEADELVASINALLRLRLRKVEQELGESEMRFRQIAAGTSDVFWIFDPRNGAALYVNPAYDTLWQRSGKRLSTDPGDWIRALHPDDQGRIAEAVMGFKHPEPFELTYRLLLADGTLRWIRDRGYPVRDRSGQIYRLARISQDVSDRKFAEEVLDTSNRRKDEFLATLAHELRNPLGPILHSVELLRADPSHARVAQSSAMIERHTRHLMHLVDDLLDIARVTQGKITIARERVQLESFINMALEAINPFLESRGHRLALELPEAPMWLDGDPVRLAQIVGNILHNAGKYTAPGGSIKLAAERLDAVVRIAISDNGIGIAPEKCSAIFDLFVQAEPSSDRALEGLGIGLALVKTLTTMHGGSIKATSRGKGHGSVFEICLPLAPDDPALAATASPPRTPAPTRPSPAHKHILIVDDNRDSAEALCQLLQLEGFHVNIAVDGPAALCYVERHGPGVIFLDIGLPGMNGYELAEKLRASPAAAKALLVALTGYGQEKDKARAFQAGFDHHVVKPAELAQLHAILGIPG